MPRPRKQHHASFGSLTRLPSGRYRARYTGPDGLRRSAPVTFATKTAAEDWLARTRADMSRDQWTAPERGLVTLAEYLADWLDSRVDLRPTTVALYRQLSRRWLLTVHGGVDLGRLPVAAITPELVRRWYAGLVADTHTAAVQQAATTSNEAAAARDWAHAVGMPLAATGRLPAAARTAWEDAGRPGAEPVRPPGPRAGRTVAAQTYRLLRAVLSTAVRDGMVDTNPCHIAKGGHVRADERRPATVQEVATIADAMSARYWAAVLVAAWSGLRGGELFALRRRDVDTATGTIRVDRTMIELPTGIDFGPPKSDAGRRTVTLPPTVAVALNEHLARFVPSNPDALLFTTATGRPVTRAQRAALLARPKRAAGRPDLTWHDLRHTGMTLAAATGASLVQLQRRLGQSTARAALIYQHATDDADRLLAEALDDAASGRTATVHPLRRSG